jgi:hypothetical protein
VKRLNLSSAVRPLADYVADLHDDTVVLTEGNRAVAALIPLKNVDRESMILSQHPEFLGLIARSRAEFAAGRTISLREMKRRVLPKRSPNKRRPWRAAGLGPLARPSPRLEPTVARPSTLASRPRLSRRPVSQTRENTSRVKRASMPRRRKMDRQRGTLGRCRRFIVKARTGFSSTRQIGTSHRTSMWSGMRIAQSSGSTRYGSLAVAVIVRQNFSRSSGW